MKVALAGVVAFVLAASLAHTGPLRQSAYAAGSYAVEHLEVEHQSEPLAVEPSAVRFSWQLSSSDRAVAQRSYQVRVAASPDALAEEPVWDSGAVVSDRSVLVDYTGPALQPQTRYFWQVRSTSTDGVDSGWSEVSWFETALAGPEAWPAEWISAPGVAAWDDVTVEIDLTVKAGSAAGVYLRSSAEGAFMWQLNDETSGTPKLRTHKRGAGALSLIDEVALTPALPADVLKSRVTMRVELSGSTIVTHVNGVEVDRRTDASVSAGTIGLRTNGVEEAVVHAVTVTAPDAAILLDADLAHDANPFAGGAPEAAGLRVSGTSDVLLRDPSDSPMLRRDITVDKEVANARLYASALGVYEISLNGQRVGDHELAPGWTDYAIRTQYQTYDVTDMLAPGDNALGIMAGPGWYSGHLGWFGPHQYGTTPAVSAFLEVEYTDNTSETFITDDGWHSALSPITYSDLLHGETYDARLEQPGWDRPGFDASAWSPVVPGETDATSTLVAQVDPPVRVVQELPALSLSEPTAGHYVFDLGQNMVGRVRLRIAGNAGETIRLRHAEVIHADGRIAPENLRSARATDYYTFAADGEIIWEPRFTFHGFRYVELSGLSVEPSTEAVTGVVIHTDGALTSQFETSDAMINQLQSNITWSQRGNFLSIPTDTPARDERMGWTGDINVFAPTATFNMDTATFFTKFMADMRDAQLPNGAYPEVAPQFCKDPAVHPSCGGGSTGWADAGITLPHTVWQTYGDTRIIEENYDSMKDYMDFLEAQAPTGIRPDVGSWGDWLNFNEPTSPALLGTAYYARSVDLMAEMAEAIGRAEDAGHYRELFNEIRTAYVERFIAADGTVEGNSQTAYVISIAFGLVPEERLDAVGTKLVAALERRDVHLATGFLGLPSLLPGLSASGHDDLAYQLLQNRTYPSWGFQIDRGATTMWERWDSIREDGSFGDLGMNSFNHFAYGAVGDWMYRNIGGISQLEPGYQKVLIAPKPGGGLTYADVSFDSVYGTIRSHWRVTTDGFALDVEVPVNTTAVVELPAGHELAVLEGGLPAAAAEGVTSVTLRDGVATLEVGSGSYSFLVDADTGRFAELADAIAQFESAAEAADVDADAAAGLGRAAASMKDAAARAAQSNHDEDAAASAAAIHEVLGSVADAAAVVHGLDPAVSRSLEGALAGVEHKASELSARMLGVGAELAGPVASVLPGRRASLDVSVRNEGDETITQVAWQPSERAGWSFDPATVELGVLAGGEQVSGAMHAAVPERHRPATVPLNSEVTYVYAGTQARLPLATAVAVAAPLTLDGATAAPGSVEPGSAVTVTLTASNSADVDVLAAASVQLPGGAVILGPQVVVPAGGSAELQADAVVPLTASAAVVDVAVGLVSGDITYATGSVELEVNLPDLDLTVLDHVDVGDAASEQAHELTASAGSGTLPNEAGFTRRYTDRTDPDGFFEVTMAAPAGQPFVLRVRETFDGPRLKEYLILVDGVEVQARTYQRPADTGSGPGSYIYHVLVDDPALLDHDGTVRVRFQNNQYARNYDPSIADLWTVAFHDHVDLGEPFSEAVHGLTASALSGSNVEAGLTRRYADREDPQGYFAFDLSVPSGEPFLVRTVETYDRASTKEYDVFIDDVLVHQRFFAREGGLGTETYQFVVNDPTVLDHDGTVRIRFQNNVHGRNYDASLAELWAVPLTADIIAPTVGAQIIPRGSAAVDGWHDGPVDVYLTAGDDRPGEPAIEYRLGDGSWASYAAPLVIRTEGATTVRFRATDLAGNTSETGEATVRIDQTAPVVTADVAGESSDGWYAPGAIVLFDATDEGSGVAAIEYRLDSGDWLAHTDPVEPGLGETTLEYRARDVAGNHSPPQRLVVTVDGTAPVVTAAVSGNPGPSGWHLATPSLTLEASDAASGVAGIEYALGDGWQPYTGPVSLPDGRLHVAFRATDQVGNVAANGTVQVQVDTVAPSAEGLVDDDRRLVLNGSDESSGVGRLEFTTDGGGGWTTWVSPVPLGASAQEIGFRAVDIAGNVGTTHHLTIDAGPAPEPTPTPDPTATATVTVPPVPGRDLYETPGFHRVGGREWMTVCESYSSTVDRCWTYIWATSVRETDGRFFQINGWVFNNLTYVGGSRADWSANPLGHTSRWTSLDGRQWRTECDTADTGRNGCRSYVVATVIERSGSTYRYVTKEVFNNQVRFR